jgi:AbiJ N-terminal domain 4
MSYFSEREAGERPRDRDAIDDVAWGGICGTIRSRVEHGSFGASFPETCPDGRGPIGTDAAAFWQVMRSETPNLDEQPWYVRSPLPATMDALDMLEFCWRAIGKPIKGTYHSYFEHHHLSYDVESGCAEFRESINRIFRRDGLVYELNENGH